MGNSKSTTYILTLFHLDTTQTDTSSDDEVEELISVKEKESTKQIKMELDDGKPPVVPNGNFE